MKTLKNLIYVLIFIVVAISCSKDNGNYDYIDLLGVDLSQIPNQVNGIIGERLFIQGNIVTTLNDNDLSFSWGIKKDDEDGNNYIDTISTEKNLDILVTLTPGENDLFYSVFNEKQGVRYERQIQLTITTPFSTGWAMLKEKNGLAELDFVSSITNTHYEDVFTNITGVSFTGKPVNIDFYWNKFVPYSKMVVLTEYDGAFLDAYSMQLDKRIEDRFRSMEYITLPFTACFINPLSTRAASFVADGKVYGKGGANVDNDSWWEIPADGDYYITNVGAPINSARMIFFDQKNKRYVQMLGGSNAEVLELVEIPLYDPDNAAFDPNDLQKDCLWLSITGVTYTLSSTINIAVCKDDGGTYYIQEFTNSTSSGLHANVELAMQAASLDENSVFANNTVQPFTYLSKGNVIHRYNRTSDAVEYDYLTVEADIKKMAVNYSGDVLGVVVDDGAGSKVILLDLNNNGAVIETYTTDSKVVDFKYKEDV